MKNRLAEIRKATNKIRIISPQATKTSVSNLEHFQKSEYIINIKGKKITIINIKEKKLQLSMKYER